MTDKSKMIDVLLEARNFLADIENWSSCMMYDQGSETYCAVGSVAKARGEAMVGNFARFYDLPEVLELDRDCSGIFGQIWKVNDNLGHEAVLESFDRTIERLKNEE